MKKFLAVLLAALMMFTTLGMFSFAEDVSGFTLNDALAKAQLYADANDVAPTVLVFNTGSAKLGSVYQGQVYEITAGPNTGCYALVSANFFAKNHVQLPAIKDAGDGMAANWIIQTNVGGEQGRTYGSGSDFIVPEEMYERAQTAPLDNYIIFYAQLVPNETTPTIAKIINIFYKVIKVLLGEELANKLALLVSEFGISIGE